MNTTLIGKILSNSASEAEQIEFQNWLSDSDNHIIHYEQMKLLWEKSGKVPNTIDFDVEAAKNKLRARVIQKNIAAAKVKKLRSWITVAASILIIMGLGALGYHQSIGLLVNTKEYTAQSSVMEVSLSDGSHVWLNANSILIVPRKFKVNRRNVKLLGEAYFEIKRDELRPFVIRTGKTTTKVLGTSFNIKMDSIQGDVSITVNSGKVAFYSERNERHAIELIAGDVAEYSMSTQYITKYANQNLNYLAWKTGVLTFENTPLYEVCKVLTQYYKQPISTLLSTNNFVLTGKFEREPLEDILSTIRLTLDVRLRQKNDSITIYK